MISPHSRTFIHFVRIKRHCKSPYFIKFLELIEYYGSLQSQFDKQLTSYSRLTFFENLLSHSCKVDHFFHMKRYPPRVGKRSGLQKVGKFIKKRFMRLTSGPNPIKLIWHKSIVTSNMIDLLLVGLYKTKKD
jgi:hypothetical protein